MIAVAPSGLVHLR